MNEEFKRLLISLKCTVETQEPNGKQIIRAYKKNKDGHAPELIYEVVYHPSREDSILKAVKKLKR